MAADTTERRRTVQALRQREEHFRAVADAAVNAIVSADSRGNIVYVNESTERIFGYTADEAVGRPLTLIMPERFHAAHERGLARFLETRASPVIGKTVELAGRTKHGHEFPVELSVSCWTVAGETFFTGILRDISDRKRVDEALQKSEERFRKVFEEGPVGIGVIGPDLRLNQVNRAFCELTGYTEEELAKLTFPDITHPEDVDLDVDLTQQVFAGEIPSYRIEKRYVRKDGETLWADLTATVVRDEAGEVAYGLGIVQDITERKRSEERLGYLAHYDALTGLPNRAMFEKHMELALARARRNRLAVAVLYLDINRFKLVNDSLGRAAGDVMLRQIGQRIRSATRAEDLVARNCGDEFLVLLGDLRPGSPGAGGSEASGEKPGAVRATELVAEKIHDVLSAAFTVHGQECYVGTSIGISFFPDDAEDPEALIKHADVALYDSKQERPGGTMVYPRGHPDPTVELSLATRLHGAMEREELVLHYQPLVRLDSGRMFGVEALVRWRDPDRGLIHPDGFIPLAEKTGMIEPIGDWVMRESCRQWRAWRDTGLDLRVGFNLSPLQLGQPDLVRRVLDSAREFGVEPTRLMVEMTESAAMSDLDQTCEILRGLGEHGVWLAIDDFGTGHSSLSRLREMPVTVLKIDGAFVQGIPKDKAASSMVAGIVQIASGIDLRPLAEGVETEEQRRFLVECGCPLAQGFHFSRPVPAESIPSLAGRDLAGTSS